jgi:hypothetical protein
MHSSTESLQWSWSLAVEVPLPMLPFRAVWSILMDSLSIFRFSTSRGEETARFGPIGAPFCPTAF